MQPRSIPHLGLLPSFRVHPHGSLHARDASIRTFFIYIICAWSLCYSGSAPRQEHSLRPFRRKFPLFPRIVSRALVAFSRHTHIMTILRLIHAHSQLHRLSYDWFLTHRLYRRVLLPFSGMEPFSFTFSDLYKCSRFDLGPSPERSIRFA